MKYILNKDIALRAWNKIPNAYYKRDEIYAKGLKKEEKEFLLLCDGKHELADLKENELAKSLISRDMIHPVFSDAEELSSWQEYKEYKNRYMPGMTLQITGKCNYNCRHCFNAADNAPLQSEFSFDETIKLLDEAKDCGINAITITGGEPLLFKRFPEIIEAIYDRGMFLSELNTNGHFLTETLLNQIRDCTIKNGTLPTLIKISFDGVGFHDWMRNKKGAEERALNAIKIASDLGHPVMAQVNVNKKNVHVMEETLDLLDDIGVNCARLIKTTNVPRWEENCEGDDLSISEYYDEMTSLLGKYIKKNRKMSIIVWQYIYLEPEEKRFSLYPVRQFAGGHYKDSVTLCNTVRGSIAISSNGDVYPCLQISGAMEAQKDYFGNVKIDGLEKLLMESKYLDCICTPISKRFEHNEKCQTCKYWKYCTGGCVALSYLNHENYGDIIGVDNWKCIFFENEYWKTLEKVLEGYENTTVISE